MRIEIRFRVGRTARSAILKERSDGRLQGYMKDRQRAPKGLKDAVSSHASTKWELRHSLKAGDIGHLTHLHGILYAKEYGHDQTFEAYVARGLGEFTQSFDSEKDRIWLAEISDRIVGSIAIAGHSEEEAQLRWFLVHPNCRGLGLGKELMEEALRFCKERGYKGVFLWTTSELDAARHLYTRVGFRRTEAKTHRIWGKTVTEERYDLRL
jgi:ribosomal protein S18 acetylase RimI-like enzyme